MFSRTGEYALRAMIHLARHEADWPVSGPRIARETDIPPKYLSAILGTLVRTGVLDATRGKRGGFRMTMPADETSLLRVLEPFETRLLGKDTDGLFDHDSTGHGDTGSVQERWDALRQSFLSFLRDTTVGEVAEQDTPSLAFSRASDPA